MVRQHRVATIACASAILLLGSWLGVRAYRAAHSSSTHAGQPHLTDQQFWKMVVDFSEPGRAFHSFGAVRTDNLISNETSFQQVIPDLQSTAIRGAYVGVGPEQNFTYITALKPTIAFIVDIRRDNMLLHLLYKALFELSADRVAFMSYLFSRPAPGGIGRASTVQALFDAFRAISCSHELMKANLGAVFDRLERVHRFALSSEDKGNIEFAYESFCTGGPDTRWDTSGDTWIPSYADLMAQVDLRGKQHGYLASEEAFGILKRYEEDNLIVPLVGDFAGDKAIRSVAGYLKEQSVRLAVFYTSNVEFYLPHAAYDRFTGNVLALPVDDSSKFIRATIAPAGGQQGRVNFVSATDVYPIVAYFDLVKLIRANLSSLCTERGNDKRDALLQLLRSKVDVDEIAHELGVDVAAAQGWRSDALAGIEQAVERGTGKTAAQLDLQPNHRRIQMLVTSMVANQCLSDRQ